MLTKVIKEILASSAIYGLGNVVSQAISIVLLPVYTRYLAPEEYGVYSLALALNIGLTYLFDMGVTTGSARQYYEYAAPEARRRVFATANTFLLGMSALSAVLSLLLAPQLADLVLGSAEYASLVRLTIGTVTINALMTIGLLDLRVREQRVQYVALTLVRTILIVVLSLCFVVALGLGVTGILLGQFLAGLVVALYVAPSSWRHFRIGWLDWTDLKEILSYGLPFVPTLFATWVIDMAGRVLLEKYGTLTDVGIYSLGQRIAMIMLLVVSAFRFDWGRLALSMHADSRSRSIYSRVLTYYLLVTALFGLGLILFSDVIFGLLVDARYWAALRLIPIFVLSHILFGVYSTVMIGTAISRTSWTQIVVVGLGALINVVWSLLFIPRYGMMATAWATAIAYILIVVGTYWFAQQYYPIRYEFGRIARLVLVSLLLLAAGYMTREVPFLPGIGLKGLLLLGFPVLLYATGFFHLEEKHALARLCRSGLARVRTVLVICEKGG